MSQAHHLVPTVKGNTLTVTTFACARCSRASAQLGSGWLRRRGVLVHVCADCKAQKNSSLKAGGAA